MPDSSFYASSALEAAQAAQASAESIADALKISEQRYRRLFEAARDGILILDSDQGKITDANPFMSELLGYSHDELIGKELWEIGLLQDKEASQAAFRQLHQDGYIQYEDLPLQNCRGERREVEFVSNLYREDGHTVIQCNIRDITERKEQEVLLAAANAQAKGILESITDAFFAIDRDWRFTYLNAQAERLLQRTHEDLLGRSIWDEFPEAVGSTFDWEYHRTVAERVAVDFEEFFPPLNTWFDVHAYPSTEGISVYFTDINTRKQAEKALTESEERLRFATEGAGVGIWKMIPATNELTWTRRCCEIFGLPTDGSMNSPGELPWTLIHPQDIGGVRAAMELAARENIDFHSEYRITTPSGETRWIQSHGKPYSDEQGNFVRVEGILSDITARKRAEVEMAAAAAKNERIAETLQRSMLQAVPVDKFPGLWVETLYQSALNEAHVGGDFFDAFALSAETIALVVGDVSGKGLLAAGRTAEVKYALRAFLHAYQSPEIALAHLNDFVCETHRLDMDNEEVFIVLALVTVDAATGEAVFSSAGAEPTLILRANGATEPVEIVGMPLGIQSNTTYTAKTLLLASGETVLMATDGITEARNGYEFLGPEGMAALAEEAGPTASPFELSQAIYGGARAFAGGDLHDDACLLIARRR